MDGGVTVWFNETPTDAQLADACMSDKHDFGLCDDQEKKRRMAAMRSAWRAIWKTVVHRPPAAGRQGNDGHFQRD